MPLFSVVIPLYNKESSVAATLESLLAQSFADFEAVVVDDGSTDRGPEMVEEVADRRIRLVRQENGGVSVARNRGIAEATGEWVVFLDADDRWDADYLESFRDAISRFPGVEACFCAYHEITEEATRVVGLADAGCAPLLVEDYLAFELSTAGMWTSATAVKREVFGRVGGFTPGVRMGEDLEMWMRLAFECPRMVYLPRALAWYDRRGEGACRQDARRLAGRGKPHYPRTFLVIEKYLREGRIPPRLRFSTRKWLEAKLPPFLRDKGYGRGFRVGFTMLWRHASPFRDPLLWSRGCANFLLGLLLSLQGLVRLARVLKGAGKVAVS
ncbi:hypothetical protein GMSM_20700 [Geomonas sp. Red276]